MSTGVCPRCSEKILARPGEDKSHGLGKCSKESRRIIGDRIEDYWPTLANNGAEQDNPGNLQESDSLLKDIIAKKSDTKVVTKWMAENAFKKVYPGTKGKNAAEMEKLSQAKNTATASAPTSSSSRPANKFEMTKKAPKGPYEGNKFAPQTAPKAANTNNSKFRTTDPPALPIEESEPKDDQASSFKNLDTEFAQHRQTAPLHVAVNYVAVKNHPTTLYEYSMKYGTVHTVKTKKQIADDEQATGDAKPSSSELIAATEKLSIGDAKHEESSVDGTKDQNSEGNGKKVSQRGEKLRIFDALKQSGGQLSSVTCATNGDTLWTLEPLQTDSQNTMVVQDLEYKKLSGRQYKLDFISFEHRRDLRIAQDRAEAAKSLIEQNDASAKGGSMRVTALNALISQYVNSKFSNEIVSVGPNKFFLKAGIQASTEMLDIHRGYYTSIRPGSQSMLLNVNVATSAFYRPQNVANFYHLVKGKLSAYGRPETLLKGLKVRIAYQREKHDDEYDPNEESNRHRVIAGFGAIPSEEYFDLDGSTISVADYFKQLGAGPLRFPNQPCVSVTVAPKKQQQGSGGNASTGKKGKGKASAPATAAKDQAPKPQWIPTEYLQIDPYQPFKKLLLNEDTEKMISAAVRTPNKNQHLIVEEGFRKLGIILDQGSDTSPFSQVGMTLGAQMLQIPARLLKPPEIFYRNKYENSPRKIGFKNASWNLVNSRFWTTPSHSGVYPLPASVGTIDMRDKNGRVQGLEGIGSRLREEMINYGIEFRNNATHDKRLYIDALGHALDHPSWDDVVLHDIIKENLPPGGNAKLFVVLLSRKHQDYYGRIKRVCDQWLGLHTVCLVQEKLGRKEVSGQQLGNLALKFNMKLGGQNHLIAPPSASQPLSAFQKLSDSAIVFGADVSHPAGGMPQTPSVASVVASYDKNFALFSASMRLQAGTQEMIEDLEDMVYYRLVYFAKKNKTAKLPNRILFYRDGVSEDQFQQCRDNEIPQIERAFARAHKDVGGTAKPRLQLTFIVVGKRHHTRFFACKAEDTYTAGKSGVNENVKPGLLVDQVIVRPPVDKTFDFFLQSHDAIKGTARSAHYTVLEQGELQAHDIKELTHAFCYNYMRATKGVSYAGPAYYADRLCDRGAHYLRGYTAGREEPPIHMTDQEKRMTDKKEAAKIFAQRVAEHISRDQIWNPGKRDENDEQNPWHASFDGSMFWL